ncbi:MAG TPA: Zn-ribbon domain-containing OB-fold protein [Spongiibacteraceae bacterium]|jgi:hypothetical protein
MTENKVIRPDPMLTPDTAFFWEAAERGELMAQQCSKCGKYEHPPRPMCPQCNSLDKRYVKLSGKGTVYSWCIPRYPLIPIFDNPLVTALIQLDEGIRLMSNVVGCEVDEVTNGMKVEVCFAPTAGGKAVPLFRPRKED